MTADERREFRLEVLRELRTFTEAGVELDTAAIDVLIEEVERATSVMPWCTCGAKTTQGIHHKPGCPAREKAEPTVRQNVKLLREIRTTGKSDLDDCDKFRCNKQGFCDCAL